MKKSAYMCFCWMKSNTEPIMMIEFPKSIATNLNDIEFPKLWWLNLNGFGISVPGSTRKSGLIWNQNQFWNIYTLITNYYWIEANQQRSYMSQLRNDDHKHWIESLASCKSIVMHTNHLMKSSEIQILDCFQAAEFNYVTQQVQWIGKLFIVKLYIHSWNCFYCDYIIK